MLDEEVIIMGRKASYRRNNVKEAVNDETAVKNVETVKEKVEAVKEKAEAAVEAVKENVKAEAVKAEAAVTAKAATEKEAEQPKPRRGRPKKSETAAKETAAKAKTPVKKPAGRSKKSTEAKKEFVIQFEGKSVNQAAIIKRVEADLKAQNVIAKDIKLYVKPEDNKCYYVADEKITGDVELF
jgi:hypothetical protein